MVNHIKLNKHYEHHFADGNRQTIIQSFVNSPSGQKYKQYDCKTVTRAFVQWAEQNKIPTQVISLAPPSADFIAKNPRYKGKSGRGDGHIMPIINGNAIDFTIRQFGVRRPFNNPLITRTKSLPAVYGKFGYFTDKPDCFGGKSHWIGSLNSIPRDILDQNFDNEMLSKRRGIPKHEVNEILIQKDNNMDKIPAYYSFYTDLITEGHCIMADVPQKESMLEFIKKIPNECVYEEVGENYGKEANPHVTVMYGLSPVEESRVKELLTKVPKKIVAELGKISKFSNTDTPYDVLKIEVKSPHLSKIHEMIRKNFDNNYKWSQYNPHVTLAYVKKGTCNEYVGNKTFEGMKVMFETFMYSNGIRELNHAVPMKEYNVGTSGGYGGGAMAGGAVAATNWAGTFSSNQTSRRLQNYPAQRKYTYMQGNTVIGSPLYDTLTDDDLIDPNFTKDEIRTGLRYEMKRMEYPDKDVAKPTVLKNLHKNPKYYSDLEMYFQSDKI